MLRLLLAPAPQGRREDWRGRVCRACSSPGPCGLGKCPQRHSSISSAPPSLQHPASWFLSQPSCWGQLLEIHWQHILSSMIRSICSGRKAQGGKLRRRRRARIMASKVADLSLLTWKGANSACRTDCCANGGLMKSASHLETQRVCPQIALLKFPLVYWCLKDRITAHSLSGSLPHPQTSNTILDIKSALSQKKKKRKPDWWQISWSINPMSVQETTSSCPKLVSHNLEPLESAVLLTEFKPLIFLNIWNSCDMVFHLTKNHC